MKELTIKGIKEKSPHTIITSMGVFMIVLNKKKIRLFVFSVFMVALGFAFAGDKRDTVPTVSLPVSGKTIVIDAGHGKPDEGGCFIEVSGM